MELGEGRDVRSLMADGMARRSVCSKRSSGRRRLKTGLGVNVFAALLVGILLASAAPAAAACPNETLRGGASASLPDCRALEQVTPTEKLGNSANGGSGLVQASTDGNGITFTALAGLPGSEGLQDFPTYLSSRTDQWGTRNLLPPALSGAIGQVLGWSEDEAYSFMAARHGFGAAFPFTFYLRDNTTGAITSLATGIKNNFAYAGSSTGASAVIFESKTKLSGTQAVENKPNVYMWSKAGGAVRLASVLNNEQSPTTSGAFAGPYEWWSSGNTKSGGALEAYYAQREHVVSQDGASVFFTAAGSGQIYVRRNPAEPQSALAENVPTSAGTASGAGTLEAGSNVISELVAAEATAGSTTEGSTVVTEVRPTIGRFVAGQPIEPVAGVIPAGTTIVEVTEVKSNEFRLTLSQGAEVTESSVPVISPGPAPFSVGQQISGIGIPIGTKLTAAAEGALTLSAPATESVVADELTGSTQCTESAKACTLQISASERATPDPNGSKPAVFLGATPDGTSAMFLSQSALTDDANTGPADEGADLYRFRPDRPLGARLTDISLDSTDPKGAEVKGLLGMSDDGSYVYFAAAGRLDGTSAPTSTCEGTGELTTGLCNIYLWHEDPATESTSLSFIAQVDAGGGVETMQDLFNWSPRAHDITGVDTLPVARVADGGALVFVSTLPLTGYDNTGPDCDPLTGEAGPCPELYRYTPGGVPSLECISCNPTGAPPKGKGTALASIEQVSQPSTGTAVTTRNMSADGNRVFFESPEQFVPEDTNGDAGCPLVKVPGGNSEVPRCQDIYEWEASGTGSCHSAVMNGGCLFLISSGTSSEPSLFGDNDSTGDNAFFFTYAALVTQDTDQLVDIYDARVNGGIGSQNPSLTTPCGEEGCKGPTAPVPVTQAPGSPTFVGPQNPPPKHKNKHKHNHKKKHKHKHNASGDHGKAKPNSGGKSH